MERKQDLGGEEAISNKNRKSGGAFGVSELLK